VCNVSFICVVFYLSVVCYFVKCIFSCVVLLQYYCHRVNTHLDFNEILLLLLLIIIIILRWAQWKELVTDCPERESSLRNVVFLNTTGTTIDNVQYFDNYKWLISIYRMGHQLKM
jgi:hypothetical protein